MRFLLIVEVKRGILQRILLLPFPSHLSRDPPRCRPQFIYFAAPICLSDHKAVFFFLVSCSSAAISALAGSNRPEMRFIRAHYFLRASKYSASASKRRFLIEAPAHWYSRVDSVEWLPPAFGTWSLSTRSHSSALSRSFGKTGFA